MRSIIYIFIFMTGISCTSPKNASKNLDKLMGTWVTVKLEMNGTLMPKESFEKQKLILSDSSYTFIAESVDKGIVKYNGDKMDIYGKDGVNTGKHFTARYKYENEQLTICYNLSGDAYPETFETKGKPMYFLAVFKKEGTK